jgi:hypothetical protein
MAETALIYAVEDIATDGAPTLEIYRRPGILDLDYDTVKGWGIQATGQRPDFVWFRGDLYLVGGFSRVLVRHRLGTRWWPAGIRQPDAVTSVVEGSGSGGSPGQCLAYSTFIHKVGERLMAESNPSNVIQLADQTGLGYDWTLQTSGAEERTTDVRCYRSMNGGPYRLAAEVPYGTGTFTENVKTNQLLQTGPSGHYLPPFGVSFAAKAFGRMWYARTNEYPHRVWGSQPGNPQYVNITDYRDTEDREPITGMAKSRDVLLVFCLTSVYILRKHGSSGFNFTLQKIDSAVGCTSHWAIKEIHNKLWFPSPDGVWLYDGGLRYAMADVREFWKQDYEANRSEFANAFAIDDRAGKNYLLYVPRPGKPAFTAGHANAADIGTVAYVGNYLNFEPSIGGQNMEPDWSMDLYNRLATCAVYSQLGEVLLCWDDAEVRLFDPNNDDDDGDTFGKELQILTGHQLFMEPDDQPPRGRRGRRAPADGRQSQYLVEERPRSIREMGRGRHPAGRSEVRPEERALHGAREGDRPGAVRLLQGWPESRDELPRVWRLPHARVCWTRPRGPRRACRRRLHRHAPVREPVDESAGHEERTRGADVESPPRDRRERCGRRLHHHARHQAQRRRRGVLREGPPGQLGEPASDRQPGRHPRDRREHGRGIHRRRDRAIRRRK